VLKERSKDGEKTNEYNDITNENYVKNKFS
jgi:hypothetical protein